jgi:hypothetical protein
VGKKEAETLVQGLLFQIQAIEDVAIFFISERGLLDPSFYKGRRGDFTASATMYKYHVV